MPPLVQLLNKKVNKHSANKIFNCSNLTCMYSEILGQARLHFKNYTCLWIVLHNLSTIEPRHKNEECVM